MLDLSSSTDSAPPREIPGVLRHLANAGGRSGLVLFSDVAYEALPLGATSEELRPFLRYFRRPALPPATGAGANGRIHAPAADHAPRDAVVAVVPVGNPNLGRARERPADGARRSRRAGSDVLLVSDLNDSLFDVAALEQTLRRYKRDGIKLRIVALRPTVENRGFFVKQRRQERIRRAGRVRRRASGQSGRPLAAGTPWALIGLISLLALALAANELLCGRLEWRTA